MSNTLIMVLGMHRSGTSCISGVLYHLGVDPGPLDHLLPANKHNQKGYWENSFIAGADSGICKTLYGSWINAKSVNMTWENMARIWKHIPTIRHILDTYILIHEVSFIKDPRFCVLLPVYFRLFEDIRGVDVRFIIVHRPKDDIIQSINKIYGYNRDVISLAIDRYYSAALNSTHGFQRSMVNFYDVLRDPISEFKRISKEINIVWPHDIDDVSDKIIDFVTPSLRHYHKE